MDQNQLNVVVSPFEMVLFGHDTVECSYYLHAPLECGVDFAQLAIERETLRQSKNRDPKPITLGSTEFLLHRSGSARGFPLVLSNADWTMECGEFNYPSFYVTFRSEALWRESAFGMHRKFMQWVESVGLNPIKPETLARVDFTFDYHLPVIDFVEDNVVSLSAKDARYRDDRKLLGCVFGKGDIVLRIYDKVAEIAAESHKAWFFGLWGRREDVWRIEWQVRKDVLRRFGIRTFADLGDQQGDVLRYLSHEHDTLRLKAEDSNRSRWQLHPLWLDLHEQIKTLNAQGIYREVDAGAAMDERLMRIAISVQGYLKRIAAVHAVQNGERFAGKEVAMKRLQQLLARVHDPLTWKADVEKRIDLIRLGQW
jgi:hypothetical protein